MLKIQINSNTLKLLYLYILKMRISKTKIIHKEHRDDERYRKRTRRITSPIEQIKKVSSENILLSLNDDTSSQSSSSSIELNMHSVPQQGQGIQNSNNQIIQSKQTQNGKLDHILLKDQESSAKNVEARQPLSHLMKKGLGQTIEDDQQGPYFFLGDEDDEDQQQEDSSQSDSDDMIEVQDEDEESDEEDQKQIKQLSKEDDSDDDSSDDDDDDSDFEAQFDDEIDLYGPHFKGQSEEDIQQEMNEYEYYQKQSISDMSLPSNFNHYQLLPKDKQEFMNLLNQMYYTTMLTDKKRRKKKVKYVSVMEKDEGEEQQKVQVGKRTPRKRVQFNQNISYRLFNKTDTIEEMIQQQQSFEQLNHVEKGLQKPIMPLQKQRVQQIISPAESTKRTAEYLQSSKDSQKEKAVQQSKQQPIIVISQYQKSFNCQNSSFPVISQQFPQLNQRQKSQQLTLPKETREGQIHIEIKSIGDENTQSFAVGQIASQVKPLPILLEQPCEGV